MTEEQVRAQQANEDSRARFATKLTPEELATYMTAMDAVKGDCVQESLTHFHFECIYLGIPYNGHPLWNAWVNYKEGKPTSVADLDAFKEAGWITGGVR